jgi:polyisoprenoid-binding protein YceI
MVNHLTIHTTMSYDVLDTDPGSRPGRSRRRGDHSLKWALDRSHTNLTFSVKHMGVFTVRGRFGSVGGTIETDDRGHLTRIEATIDATSIDTAEPKRDAHLRSPDFLDVGNHPTLTFACDRIEPIDDVRYRVRGDLTIRGVTRPVTFEVETTPPITDPWGNRRAGATATAVINRRDWGLTWNQVLEMGALLVGDEIKVALEAEAVALEPAVA